MKHDETWWTMMKHDHHWNLKVKLGNLGVSFHQPIWTNLCCWMRTKAVIPWHLLSQRRWCCQCSGMHSSRAGDPDSPPCPQQCEGLTVSLSESFESFHAFSCSATWPIRKWGVIQFAYFPVAKQPLGGNQQTLCRHRPWVLPPSWGSIGLIKCHCNYAGQMLR